MPFDVEFRVHTPPFKWAQRSDRIYVTIDVADLKNVDVKIDSNGRIRFEGKGGSEHELYELDVELMHEVNADESKYHVLARSVFLNIKKKDDDEEYWPYLLKTKKHPQLSVDWNRWVDEDETAEDDLSGMGQGFDMSQLGAMGGMPGMGGMGGMGGMPGMPGMGGMGGMPGMGDFDPSKFNFEDMGAEGGDEGDSDDDPADTGLPDLEPTEDDKK